MTTALVGPSEAPPGVATSKSNACTRRSRWRCAVSSKHQGRASSVIAPWPGACGVPGPSTARLAVPASALVYPTHALSRIQRGGSLDARIRLDRETDIESLWDWLRREPDLQGHMKLGHPSPPAEEMGAPVELVVLLSAACGTVATALARTLTTWLRQRRSDVNVIVTLADGRSASITAQRIRAVDAEKLLRSILQSEPAGATKDE